MATTNTNKPDAINDKPQTATIEATIEGENLTLAFINGETLTIHAAALSDDIRKAAMMHGLKQKLVDAAAISRNPENGRAATVETKFLAVKDVADRLAGGNWNKPREGAGGGVGGLLFQALVRMYEGRKTAEDIKTYLDGKTDAEKAALRKNPRVADIIATIRAENTKPGDTDTDELLAELED
jgi:hypothetical protein